MASFYVLYSFYKFSTTNLDFLIVDLSDFR